MKNIAPQDARRPTVAALCSAPADFTQLDHRPWPLPAGRWTWGQSWFDLLFAHWPISVHQLRPLLPTALEIDTFDGVAWIGVVPFTLAIQYRYGPPLPTAAFFPEINVRTYVTHRGKPGVWFFSLDAASAPAVWAARRFFYLPYHRAQISAACENERIVYQSRRRSSPVASFAATYWPTGSVFRPPPDSLEHWLTERYCLFTQTRRGKLLCGEIHHAPWPLQTAAAEITENTMLAPLGLPEPNQPPLLHYSQRLDVALWPFNIMV